MHKTPEDKYNALIRGQIRAAIRRVWTRYSKERRDVLAKARRHKKGLKKDGSESLKPDIWFVCALCKKEHKQKDINIDHIIPVGVTPEYPPKDTNYQDWGIWINALFCEIDNLRCLCKPCHGIITAAQRKYDAQQIRRKKKTKRNSNTSHKMVRR